LEEEDYLRSSYKGKKEFKKEEAKKEDLKKIFKITSP